MNEWEWVNGGEWGWGCGCKWIKGLWMLENGWVINEVMYECVTEWMNEWMKVSEDEIYGWMWIERLWIGC